MLDPRTPIRQPPRQNRGLLLLGHGSERGPEAARPVRALARELRGRGAFARVEVGFWKERPFFHEALSPFQEAEIAVVPVFTSEGHYTRTVIPRELGLRDPARRRPGTCVRLCPPVGTHPGMMEVILERAREAAKPGWALVLVGHGTPRHPDSGRVTEALATRLAPHWTHGPVAPAFLDQEPRVEGVVPRLEGMGAVVVPFFIAEGWHAGVTLPRSLAVRDGEGVLGQKAIRYTPPVGTHPRLADFVLDLAGRP